jgi:carbon storage regulator CsrA
VAIKKVIALGGSGWHCKHGVRLDMSDHLLRKDVGADRNSAVREMHVKCGAAWQQVGSCSFLSSCHHHLLDILTHCRPDRRTPNHLAHDRPYNRQGMEESAMVFMNLKKGDSFVIGDDITVSVVDIRKDKVRLSVIVPQGCSVHRQEVLEAIHARAATEGPPPPVVDTSRASLHLFEP